MLAPGFLGLALRQDTHSRIDGRPGRHLRAAPERRIAQFRKELLQRQTTHELMSQQATVNDIWIFAGLHHEFIEPWSTRKQNTRMPAKLIGSIGCLREVLFGEFFEAHL